MSENAETRFAEKSSWQRTLTNFSHTFSLVFVIFPKCRIKLAFCYSLMASRSVLFVGRSQSGKTLFLNALTNGTSLETRPTVGLDVRNYLDSSPTTARTSQPGDDLDPEVGNPSRGLSTPPSDQRERRLLNQFWEVGGPTGSNPPTDRNVFLPSFVRRPFKHVVLTVSVKCQESKNAPHINFDEIRELVNIFVQPLVPSFAERGE
jgi:hypothetical protein